MDNIILARIEALHVRTVQEIGLRVRHKGKNFYTGTITSVLDDSSFDNIMLFDFDSRRLKIRWSVITMMPFLADATSRGEIGEEEASTLRASFEEEGFILENGIEFDVSGPGRVAPGSLFSNSVIASGNKGGCPPPQTISQHLNSGKPVTLMFNPDGSILTVKLPSELGGENHVLNLTGGFTIRKVISLPGQGAERLWEDSAQLVAQ